MEKEIDGFYTKQTDLSNMVEKELLQGHVWLPVWVIDVY